VHSGRRNRGGSHGQIKEALNTMLENTEKDKRIIFMKRKEANDTRLSIYIRLENITDITDSVIYQYQFV